jgi:PilZ domain
MSTKAIHFEADFTLQRGQFSGACRRGARRFRFSLETLGYLTFDDASTQEVWLIDLSESGIGFYSDWPMETGTILVLQLTSLAKHPLTLTAKVAHSTKNDKGDWLIGCEFMEQLKPEMVEQLL